MHWFLPTRTQHSSARTHAHTTSLIRQADVAGNGRGNADKADDDENVDDRDDDDYSAGHGYAHGGDAAANAEAEDAGDVQARVAAYGRLSGKTNRVQPPSLPKPRAQKVRCVSECVGAHASATAAVLGSCLAEAVLVLERRLLPARNYRTCALLETRQVNCSTAHNSKFCRGFASP